MRRRALLQRAKAFSSPCMFGTAVNAEAAPILADFRAELWFSYTFPDKGRLVVQADPFDCFWFTLKDGGTSTFQLELSPPVPEPAAMTLLGIGIAGLGARKWRQRRKS